MQDMYFSKNPPFTIWLAEMCTMLILNIKQDSFFSCNFFLSYALNFHFSFNACPIFLETLTSWRCSQTTTIVDDIVSSRLTGKPQKQMSTRTTECNMFLWTPYFIQSLFFNSKTKRQNRFLIRNNSVVSSTEITITIDICRIFITLC